MGGIFFRKRRTKRFARQRREKSFSSRDSRSIGRRRLSKKQSNAAFPHTHTHTFHFRFCFPKQRFPARSYIKDDLKRSRQAFNKIESSCHARILIESQVVNFHNVPSLSAWAISVISTDPHALDTRSWTGIIIQNRSKRRDVCRSGV